MNRLLEWLSVHKFEAHLISFLLIIVPSGGLYYAAQIGSASLILALLGLVITGNLLAVATR